MTRPSSASTTEDLFDAIAKRLPADQRAIFYERMLYFRHLRPEDELLRIAEAMGFLALVIRDAPHDLAIERERLAELFTTSLAAVHAAGDATRQYHQALDARVTRVAADIGQEISAPAIAQAITENIRQQFVRSGLPDTADALAVVAKQLKHSVGEFQRTANQLNDDCTGAVRAANRATVSMLQHVGSATDTARFAVAEFRKTFSLDYRWALSTLGTAMWLLGVASGCAIERWKSAEVPVVPPAVTAPAPAQVAEPSSSVEPRAKQPPPAPARDRHRKSSTLQPRDHDGERFHGTDVERGSNSDGTASSPADAKP